MKNAGEWRRWLYGVWAVGEVLLFGGLVYGWPSLVLLLKPRHIFRDRCHHDVTHHIRHNHSDVMLLNGPLIADMNSSELSVNNDDVFPMKAYVSKGPQYTSTTVELIKNTTKYDNVNVLVDSTTVPNSFTVSHGNYAIDKGGNFSDAGVEDRGDNCVERDEAFALAYTIITAVQSVGSIGVGHAQRSLGTRTTRIGSGLTYIGGLLMVGFVTPEHSALIITGMVCVAVAGLALLVTNIQLGVLFGKGQTTFVGILSGCFDVSAIMQLVITGIVSSGADYLGTYIGVAVLSCLTLVSTFLWLPKGPVMLSDKQVKGQEIVIKDEDVHIIHTVKEEVREPTSYVTSPKLLQCLTSPLYLLHVLWFSFLQLRLFFFVGVMNPWLNSLTGGNVEEVAYFTSVQLYSGISSVLFAVVAGSLYDIQRHRYKDAQSREKRYLAGAVLPMLLGSALCCCLSALVLISTTDILYLTFLVLAAFRSFLYSLAAAFIALTFPAELFGVLYGTMIVSGGVVGCLQFLLFIWSEHSNDSIMHVNVCLLCTSAVTFLHPLHLLWKCWRSHLPPSSSAFSPVTYSPADSASGQNPSEEGQLSCDTPNVELGCQSHCWNRGKDQRQENAVEKKGDVEIV